MRCTQSTLRTEVKCLDALAEQGDRLIVSWARHDLELIERYVDDPKLVERARARFRNALPTARQWLKRTHPQLELERTWGGKYKLAVFCELMDISVPEKYGRNVAAKGIRATREAIAKYGSYSAIPLDSGVRKAWMAVLGHNRLDCRNAREVVTRSSRP